MNGGSLAAGGTVWDAIVYDPELDLVFIGVGNGGPWAGKFRSPKGGDDLLTCSIVALKPETGEYVWHYQENPDDDWDYDSDEQIILADLTIDGSVAKSLAARSEEWFFLCARSGHWSADFRQAIYLRELGHGHRSQDAAGRSKIRPHDTSPRTSRCRLFPALLARIAGSRCRSVR